MSVIMHECGGCKHWYDEKALNKHLAEHAHELDADGKPLHFKTEVATRTRGAAIASKSTLDVDGASNARDRQTPSKQPRQTDRAGKRATAGGHIVKNASEM
jgi:hypothetical protein